MTDRQTDSPGQYKAVVTTAELAKMQNGEEFVINLVRDDHPITEGTPYNKESVLPDELAEQLCPDIEDPTPADAFRGLNDRILASRDYPGCYYRCVDGRTEWINPPMIVGKEYCTTERWDGKLVYIRLVNCGAFENGKITYIEAGFDARIVDFSARIGYYAIPCLYENNMAHGQTISVSVRATTDKRIAVTMYGGSYNSGTVYAMVKYYQN